MSKLEDAAIRVSNIRRPLILIRGKSLDRKQLVELVSKTEPLFKDWAVDGTDEADYYNSRSYCGALRNICFRKGFDWLDGWLLEDGTCYGAYYLPKYPDADEWIPTFEYLAESFPFLDMVATVVDSDESYCYNCCLCDGGKYYRNECKRMCILKKFKSLQNTFKTTENLKYKTGMEIPNKYKAILDNHYLKNFIGYFSSWNLPFDIHKDVIMTLNIKGGQCQSYVEEEAMSKFVEYDKLYGDFRLLITQDSSFFKCSNSKKEPSYVRFSTQFFRECLEYLELPVELWDKKIVPEYLIKPVGYKECVVSKEWLYRRYEEYFKDTIISINNIREIGADYNV